MTSSPIPRMPLLRGLSPKPTHPRRKEESRTWRSSSSHGGDVRGAPSWSHNSEDQAPEPQARGSHSIQELTRAPPPAGGAEMRLPHPHAPPPALVVLAGHRSLTPPSALLPPFVHTRLCLELLCREDNGIRCEPLCSAHPPTHLPWNQANQACSVLSASRPSNLFPRRCS